MEVGEGLWAEGLADPLLLILLVALAGLHGVDPPADVVGADGLGGADVLVPEEGEEVLLDVATAVVPGADLHAGEGFHEVLGPRFEGHGLLVLAGLAGLDEALALTHPGGQCCPWASTSALN
ncbi:hypothetical protein [Streptomyces nigra]